MKYLEARGPAGVFRLHLGWGETCARAAKRRDLVALQGFRSESTGCSSPAMDYMASSAAAGECPRRGTQGRSLRATKADGEQP
jgi:hypothetical protein